LSGCPSVTDSDVKLNRGAIMNVVLKSCASLP
jgi:hypothetical protein